jgi:hypothetical protein
MATQVLPQVLTQFHVGTEQRRILNIARCDRRWFVELETLDRCDYLRRSGCRVSVAPAVGRAMLGAAQREGAVMHVHRWSSGTTYHLRRDQEGGG